MLRQLRAWLVAVGMFAPVTAAAQTPRLLTVDDLFALKQVGDPQISPDGRWVAYTVTTTDLKAEKSESRLWMAPLAGGEAVPLTAPGSSASAPRWSPDGRYISFLAARKSSAQGDSEPKAQVWTLDRRGGEARPLTHVGQGVEAYEWSPDGSKLVLVIRDTLPTWTSPKTARPWVITRLQFKRDEVGYLDTLRTHLYVFTPASDALTQITAGNYDDAEPVWSPDGKSIAFVSNRSDNPDGNLDTNIWIVAADNADRGKTLRQVTTNPGSDEQPAWSPDGQWIAYVTVVEPDLIWYATEHLAVAPAQGGAPRILTRALDRTVARPRFSPDGRAIYFLVDDHGERDVARIAPSGNDLSRPIAGDLDVASFALGPGGALAALIATPARPGEIFRLERGQVKQVTFTNDSVLASLRLAGVEKTRFSSRDGTPIEGFVYTPPGFAHPPTPGPALLRIHGGPVAQYTWAFNFEAQLLAAHGYVVIHVNPRGSSGYGQDFCRAIWADWGNKDYDDVMAGVDDAVRRGYADRKRLGVGGWSYGGILTNYVITKTDRFAAAISGASEVLYAANYGHDHYQYEWERELGLPWKNRALWERLSPFNSVERVVTPTLLMGGDKDWNVPVQNVEQLYQALRRLGRPTELVVYPGQSHRIRTPSYLKDRLERYLAWYDRWVKGAGATATLPR